ncbi:TerB family tellurite resistance protein [Parasedimentitalea huanghaiensis]|nr:TerB family tellurite resistance protein [Zongyanglinia huanghaiensis]
MEHTKAEQIASFDGVNKVVENEERFKARIGAGSSTFSSLRTANVVSELWAVSSAARDGAAAAASAGVASTFFAPTGVWALITGASALTPVGWVIGAAVATGGLSYGVGRLFRSYQVSRVEEIPKFFNTPIDVLGATLVDMVGALALKVASMDGNVDDLEKSAIRSYFSEEWGISNDYALHAIELLEENVRSVRLSEMTEELAEFARTNPDCDFSKIQKGLTEFLHEVAEADGRIDESEELAIEKIVSSFAATNSTTAATKRVLYAPIEAVTSATGWAATKFGFGKKPTDT